MFPSTGTVVGPAVPRRVSKRPGGPLLVTETATSRPRTCIRATAASAAPSSSGSSAGYTGGPASAAANRPSLNNSTASAGGGAKTVWSHGISGSGRSPSAVAG